MTDDGNDDQEWQEKLDREDRRRKQRMVLFGTTEEEQAEAEANPSPREKWKAEQAANAYPDKVKFIINDVEREYHAQLQAIAFKHGLSLSQLGQVGLVLVIGQDHDGTLGELLEGIDRGESADDAAED